MVHFCAGLGCQNGTAVSDEDGADRRRSLRAGLAEFASLDEAAAIDTAARVTSAPKMLSLNEPRVHVVRLLRHANIHLAVSQVAQTSRPASWNDQDFTFRIHYSPEIGSSIQRTEQSQKYEKSDMAMMIAWIQAEQMEWGLDHLICQTAELYSRILLGACGT